MKYYVVIDESSGRYHELFSRKLFKSFNDAKLYIKLCQKDEENELGYLLRTTELVVEEMEVE